MKITGRSLLALVCIALSSAGYAAVGVNKSFTPNSVVSTQSSTLAIVLLNPNVAAATSVALTDPLPAGVTVANPLVVGANTCGFSTAAVVPGGGSIPLSGGTIPALSGGVAGQCQIQINVVSSSPNTYLNTIAIGAVSSSQGTNSQAAQATLVVSAPINVTGSKVFAPTNVHGDSVTPSPSTLTITLTNPNAIALTSAAITDSLPAAVTITNPLSAATTCGGTATASSPSTVNPATIALSGGTIPANGSCTLSVAVVARNPNALLNGNQTNTIVAGALTTTQGATSPAIAANINVQTGASAAKAFAPATIVSGGTSTMTITYTNFNTSALAPITFTDTFLVAPGMVATALPATTCGGGAITTVPAQPSPGPYTSFTLTGGSLAGVVGPGAGSTTCTVTAPVTAVSTGTNSLGTNNFGGVVIGAASGTLSVSAITGSKSFTTPALQTGTTTMTITLNNLTAAAATITSLRDDLTTMGAGFTVHSGATPGGTCGTTLTSPTPGTLITTTGGTIPANSSCTITLPLDISPTAATGNRTNTIAVANNAVNGVHTTAGNNTIAITGVVNVQRALTESKAFVPATIQGGATSRLTVTMAPTVNLTGAGFTDDLLATMGAGFVVAPVPNAVATNCTGGTVTANAGATSFALSGAALTAGSNCTVAVNIATPASTGTFTNRILAANFTTTPGVTNGDATANLVLVNTSVTVNKSFSPTTVPIGNTTAGNPNFSTLSIQIRNNNAGAIALTGVGLTDVFPSGMVVANPATASFSGAGCSGASITAPVGATQLVLANASVNANSICTLSVRVVGTVSGNLIDNVPAGSISDAQGVTNPLQGTATLAVTGTVNLTVTKTDGVASVVPGTNTTYTMTVSNAGPNDVTGLGVNDTPPSGMTFTSWTCAASAGSACPASGSGPIAASVTVLHAGSVTFTVTAAIASSATGSITNTVSLAVPGSVIDTNPVTSASDTDTLTPQADLAITKTDGVTTAVPGTTTTYTIVASNNGPSDAPGATVADTLLGGAIASATWTCSASLGSSCPASGSGDINVLVNLLAGGNATFTVVATISTTAIGTVTNTATVTAPAGVTETNNTNNSATDTDTLTPQADLAITKTDGVPSVNAGGSTTYTIVASNNGPSAVTGATVADSAPVGLTLGAWTCAATAGSSCPASGSGNISATVNLLVGGKATFTVPATVSGSATGTIANTATIAVPVGVTDPIPGNNGATDTDTVTPVADLAITKTDGVTSVVPGTSTTYTIVVTNNGPSGVTGVKISDLLPATVTSDTFTAVATGSATGFTTSGTGNINDTVNMPSGSTITYTLVANISASATGNLVNTATVTAPAGVTDPNLANNSATDTDTLTPQVDLSITKTDGVTSAVPGTSTTYTIVVGNTGPSDVSGATVSDVLPTAIASDTFTAIGTGSASGFTASGSGNINDTVNLPVGATITYTLVANIASDATGSLVNTATVTAPNGVTDTNLANNSATDTDTLNPQVTLAVVKTDGSTSYTPGGTATYTVTVTDTGASDAADVSVDDTLPPGVTLTASVSCVANGSASCGTVTGGIGDSIFGTTGATVGAGMGNSLVFTVPVAFATGMITNPLVNTATATDLATNATASDSDSDMLAPQVTLAVAKTDGSTSYTPGGTATYTVTVTHGGLSDATNVTVSDTLPSGVTLTASASCVATGSASCGTVSGLAGQTSLGATGASIAAGPGNSLVFTAPVAFAAGMTTDPLINTATATDALSGASGSGFDSDARSPQVSLAVLKTDGSATYTPGGTATYMITVKDTGVTDALDVSVDDTLPTGVTLTGTVICTPSGSATCGSVTGTTGQTSFSVTSATIGAGGGNSLVFTVPVAFAADLADNPLVNAATANDLASGASGSGSDSDVLAAQAALTVTKTDGSATYTPGGSATYTIVVTNAGPSDATNTTVSDPLPSSVTLSANASCVPAGAASCGTVTGTTGQSSFGTTGASIPAGAGNSLTFTVPVAFASAMTTDPLLNMVTVTDPASASPATASDSDTLNATVDLAITKSDGVTTAVPGQSVTYTIVVSNTGPSDAIGATVTDTLPAAIASATWSCVASGAGSSCTASGTNNVADTVNVPVGATLTYTVVAAIAPGATGTLTNTASVAAPAGVTDSNPGNNSATDSDTLTPQADLAITKTDGVTTVSPGGALIYTIVASNAGPSAVTGATVTDTAPGGLTLGSWTCSASSGSSCPASGSGNISASVNLLSGGNATFTVNATVSVSATGSVANTATIAAPAGVTDPTPADNSATDTDTITLAANLALTKTDGSATYTPGGTATYTITVTNSGPSSANNVTVTDNLPSGVTLTASASCVATGTATCGTLSGSAGGSAFTATGATLAAGAGNRLLYSLPVRFATTLNTPTLTNSASAADPAAATVATGSDTDTLAAPGKPSKPAQPVPGNDPRTLALLAALLLLSGLRWHPSPGK